MTLNKITITNTELEAIRSVEHELGGRILPPKLESISEDVDKLTGLLKRLEPATPADQTTEQPHQESQGSSVIDRGSNEIGARWAKETIGLVVVELNEAYEQFVITSDGGDIPTGKICGAFHRLKEAMQRLNIVDYDDLDRSIPF